MCVGWGHLFGFLLGLSLSGPGVTHNQFVVLRVAMSGMVRRRTFGELLISCAAFASVNFALFPLLPSHFVVHMSGSGVAHIII